MKRLANQFDLLISTVPKAYPIKPFVNVLKQDATLVNVDAMEELQGVTGINVVYARKSIAGSMIGGIVETQEVIDYCAARNVKAPSNRTDSARRNESGLRTSREQGRALSLRHRHGFAQGVTNGATERGITSCNRQTVASIGRAEKPPGRTNRPSRTNRFQGGCAPLEPRAAPRGKRSGELRGCHKISISIFSSELIHWN